MNRNKVGKVQTILRFFIYIGAQCLFYKMLELKGILTSLIPGSKGHKSGASLHAGEFVTLGPAKNMSKKPFFEEK